MERIGSEIEETGTIWREEARWEGRRRDSEDRCVL